MRGVRRHAVLNVAEKAVVQNGLTRRVLASGAFRERRPPQRVRVLRAGRLLADGPEAGEGVELVGERHRDRDRVRAG